MEVALLTSSVDPDAMAFDLRTGLPLTSFKSNLAALSGTAVVAGELVVSAQAKGSAIHIWNWSGTQPRFRCHAAERIGPVATTSDGALCAVGGITGKVYLWELSTGTLLCVWDGHYKAVRALCFSGDESRLYSGGEDAMLSAWDVLTLDGGGGRGSGQSVSPLWTASDHSLPVTAVHAPSVGARVYSASLDRTGKVWDAVAGRLLFSFAVGTSLAAVATDPAQSFVFLGADDGRIFQFDMDTSAAAATDVLVRHIDAGIVDSPPALQELSCDGKPVTSLASTVAGDLLLSGHSDGSVRVWHVASRQCVRKLGPLKGPISSVVIFARPEPRLDAQPTPMTVPVAPFKKFGAASCSGDGQDAALAPPLVVLAPAGQTSTGAPLRRGKRRRLVEPPLSPSEAVAAAGGWSSQSAGAPMEAEGEEGHAAAAADSAKKLREMAATIEKLQDETRRWQQVNAALWTRLGDPGGGGTAVGGDDSA